VDDVFGWNFREDDADVMDYGGHDTHIAGVIAARSNNGRGIAGVNPKARIMALKVANFISQAGSLDIARAIFYAADHGARVINISYGGKRISRVQQMAIDYARTKGALVVVAAGNEADDASRLGPTGNSGVITVAGTTLDDRRAGFSNWGQVVHLAAPAMDILSLRARRTDFLLHMGDNPDYEGGFAFVGRNKDLYRASGTSFAAPFVSGTASLLFSLRPELAGEQVERMLLMSCRDIETRGWDQLTGYGLLDARKALRADPDYYAYAKIARVAPTRRGGRVYIRVYGQAEGSELEGRWLQIGFGDNPGKDAWVTVGHAKDQVADGLLGEIPVDRFDRRGKWTIRLLTRDRRKLVRGARATLNLE
jgi:subtilisin family serine protease